MMAVLGGAQLLATQTYPNDVAQSVLAAQYPGRENEVQYTVEEVTEEAAYCET